eukprot:gnl/TRDRNA2_/TRDRNA2_30905_c0_seq1.p1 gnl/TRDRNA2_/TRDRNA2_30905_c0~~gnl/TRDRNA2_/TRDRNA2_30905_c0_seq1.p1  ORF type:complete len:160 (-),score=22.09 gnl/TRDRNA2_/TRDRNA2_30905_c0_seq1:146-625(-)
MSMPKRGFYLWTYEVTIRNDSDRTVQLFTRDWIVTDENGVEECCGIWHDVGPPGRPLKGAQPVLQPGHFFTYWSYCPLPTPNGTMQCTYEMTVMELQTTQDGSSTFRRTDESFFAFLEPFGLTTSGEHAFMPLVASLTDTTEEDPDEIDDAIEGTRDVS